MFNDNKVQFTFRCEDCSNILTSEFEDEKDIEDIRDNTLWLECTCGGKTYLLRD